MADKAQAQGGSRSGRTGTALARAERLKAALKTNIARRKAQAVARGAAAGARTDNKTDSPQG